MNSIEVYKETRLSRYASRHSAKQVLCARACLPVSAGKSKFPFPAIGGIIELRYCRGEKRFPLAVLVTTELDEPPAEKALLFLK